MKGKTLLLLFGLAICFSTFSQNSVKIIDDSHEALQIRLDMIRNAQSEILISTFIFTQDSIAKFFLSELQIAVERGVKVKVLIDGFNKYFRPRGVKYLNRLGIEVLYYNSFKGYNIAKFAKYRLHNKIFLTDNNYAIIGGRNIGSEYYGLNDKNFRDRDILISGPKVEEVRDIFNSFFESKHNVKSKQWPLLTCFRNKKQCAKRDTRLIHDLFSVNQVIIKQKLLTDATECYWQKELIAVDSITIYFDGPGLNKKSSCLVGKTLILALKNAKKEVVVQTPYLILTDEFYHVFHGLTERNIDVTILTNSNLTTDGVLAQSSYINGRDEILEMDINLFEYRGKDWFHSKSLMIDDLSLVGSMNIDPRSLKMNKEIVAFIKGESFSRALKESMAKDFKSSHLLTHENKPVRSTKLFQRVFISTLQYFIVPRIKPFL